MCTLPRTSTRMRVCELVFGVYLSGCAFGFSNLSWHFEIKCPPISGWYFGRDRVGPGRDPLPAGLAKIVLEIDFN